MPKLFFSGNRTAVAPPTPSGLKGSSGNGCYRVFGSLKGASLGLRPFFLRKNRAKAEACSRPRHVPTFYTRQAILTFSALSRFSKAGETEGATPEDWNAPGMTCGTSALLETSV